MVSVPWVTTIGAVSFQDSAHHAQQEQTIRVCNLQAVFVHQGHDIDFGVGQAQPLEVAVNFTIDVRHGASEYTFSMVPPVVRR
jgi:hypothetical protein